MRISSVLLALSVLVFSNSGFADSVECNNDCDLPNLIKKCRQLAGDGQIRDFNTKVHCRNEREKAFNPFCCLKYGENEGWSLRAS